MYRTPGNQNSGKKSVSGQEGLRSNGDRAGPTSSEKRPAWLPWWVEHAWKWEMVRGCCVRCEVTVVAGEEMFRMCLEGSTRRTVGWVWSVRDRETVSQVSSLRN